MDMNDNPVWSILDKEISKLQAKENQVPPSDLIDEDIKELLSNIDEKNAFNQAVKEKESKRDKMRKKKSLFWLIVLGIVVLIIGLLGTIFFRYDRFKTVSTSMSHTIVPDERLLYKKNHYIQRFNVVIVKQGKQEELLRVVGMPGDDVQMIDDILYINKSEYDEEYLKQNFINFKYKVKEDQVFYTQNFDMRNIDGTDKDTQTIPQKKYLLLGDNRQESSDSRDNGLYNEADIVGVVLMTYWPVNKIGPVH